MIAYYKEIVGFDVIVSKNKLMFDESSIAFDAYFFCDGLKSFFTSTGRPF
jgi:hypothetical protein